MNQYQQLRTYLEALAFNTCGLDTDAKDGLADDRGEMAEKVVLVGVALVATAAVAGILWQTLSDGAGDVTVPAPQAP